MQNKKLVKSTFDIYDIELKDPKNYLRVHYIPSYKCNQNCSYCLCKTHPEKNRGRGDINNFDKVIEFIEIQDREFIEFSFFGGEPTIHPDLPNMFEKLINKFGERITTIDLLTNLSNTFEYYKNLKEIAPQTGIICSLHTDFCDDYGKWFEKVDKLIEIDMIDIVKVVLSNTNYDLVHDICEKYGKKYKDNTEFTIQSIFQIDKQLKADIKKSLPEVFETCGCDYDLFTENSLVVETNGNRVPYQEIPQFVNFKGMMCSAGFWIMPNGDVLKCARDIVHERKPYFNIYKNEIYKIPKWEMCRYDDCIAEQRYKKLSIKKYLELIENGRQTD